LLAALVAGAAPAVLAAASDLQQGRDWTPIDPARPGDVLGKIEVLEFFSYGCPHCREFHPLVSAWAGRLPKDVNLRRVPVSFDRAAWANLVRLYYALEVDGHLARLDLAVFDAIHTKKINLFTEKAIFDWVATQGIDANQFRATFASFGVQSQLSRSDGLTRAYKVEAVPLLTVAGRYAVVGRAMKGYPDLLTIADSLIDKARGQGAGKPG